MADVDLDELRRLAEEGDPVEAFDWLARDVVKWAWAPRDPLESFLEGLQTDEERVKESCRKATRRLQRLGLEYPPRAVQSKIEQIAEELGYLG